MPAGSKPSQFASAPMLFLAASFAGGIAVSESLPWGLAWTAATCFLCAVAALALSAKPAATFLIMVAFAACGSTVYELERSSVSSQRIRQIYDNGQIPSGEPVEIVGTVSRGAETAVDGYFITLIVESIQYRRETRAASGAVRLFASATSEAMHSDYRSLNIQPGSRVRIACELVRDDGFRNPGGRSRKEMLDAQALDAIGTIKSPLLIENLGRSDPQATAAVFGIRGTLIEKYRELFSPQVAGVMIASLLGNKYYLDKATAEVFRDGGTFHVLVISGLHITFIGGLAAVFVGYFTRRKWIQFAIVCSFLWLYTIAVGAEIPVVRASLMFTVLWFSYVIHRIGSLANALGVCGFILLAWRPDDLFTPSFQLTFVSVGAIVLAGFPLVKTLRSIGEWTPSAAAPFPARVPRWLARFSETLYWNPKRWDIEASRNVWTANLFKAPFLRPPRPVQRVSAYLFEGTLISFLVQIAMLPLLVHYFHRVTPISIPLNLWVGFVIALESFLSLFAVLFSFVGAIFALPFVWMTEMAHSLLISIPTFVTAGWSSFRVPVYAGREAYLYGGYLLCVAVLAIGLISWDPFRLPSRSGVSVRRKAMMIPAIAVLVLGSIIVLHPFSEPRPDGSLHVEFLDVGQGDSIFIAFPNGKTMLVDGGGRPSYRDEDDGTAFEPDVPSIGEIVVSEFLWEKGYSQIDYLVATHADADHIQGLSDVAANFDIGQAWIGNPDTDDPDIGRLRTILADQGTSFQALSRGDSIDIGGVKIDILNPSGPGNVSGSGNDRSLVIRLTYGDTSILLTGDLERFAETELAREGLDISADVLKVPHHGSRTSSTAEFIEKVRPQLAVIPVGQRSMFGHPHREVVDRLAAVGARVLTTGDHGTISVTSDGRNVTLRLYVEE